jgi:hypothetical protein
MTWSGAGGLVFGEDACVGGRVGRGRVVYEELALSRVCR